METEETNKNDLIKIKEDAIKIQIHDLDDTIKSIENENIKSSFVLGFSGVLFGIAFNQLDKLPLLPAIIFVLLLSSAVVISLFNISAKKVKIHINVDEVFVNNNPNDWETYLNYKHLRYREIYENAKNLLYQKANLTRLSFILLILSSLSLTIIKLFWR
jgi:hypothetical protein